MWRYVSYKKKEVRLIINLEVSVKHLDVGRGGWTDHFSKLNCRCAGEHTSWWTGANECTCFQFPPAIYFSRVTVQTLLEMWDGSECVFARMVIKDNLSEHLFSINPKIQHGFIRAWLRLLKWSSSGILVSYVGDCNVYMYFFLLRESITFSSSSA